MTEVTRDVQRTRTWNAWSGDLAALMRVCALFEEIVLERRAALLTQFDKEVGEAPDQDFTTMMARADIDRDWRPQTTLTSNGESVKGPSSVVLREFDRRVTSSILLEAGDQLTNSISVEFNGNNNSKFGSRVSVRSPDRGWAQQAFVSLSEEVEKGVPWWRYLQSSNGGLIVGLVVFASTFSTVDLLVPSGGPMTLYWIIFIALLIGAYTVGGARVRTFLFPRFEVIAEGTPSSGSRRILSFGGLLVAVIVGVIVNRIS